MRVQNGAGGAILEEKYTVMPQLCEYIMAPEAPFWRRSIQSCLSYASTEWRRRRHSGGEVYSHASVMRVHNGAGGAILEEKYTVMPQLCEYRMAPEAPFWRRSIQSCLSYASTEWRRRRHSGGEVYSHASVMRVQNGAEGAILDDKYKVM